MYTVYMWKFSEPQTKKEVWPQTRLLLKANLLTSSFLEQWKRTTLQTNHPSLISVWNYWLSSWNLVMWVGLIGKKNDESSNGGTSSALVTQCRRQFSGSRVDQWMWLCEAPMPHPAVGVHALWRLDDLRDGKVDVVGVADARSDAAETRKCSMDLQASS